MDVDGEVIQKEEVPCVEEKELIKVLKSFEGSILQRPPSFSAIRKNNIRLYELARKDIHIHVKPKKIEIGKINLLSIYKKILEIEVTCSTGTYIRSLARDIGRSLKTCAYLKSLTRTRIGDFDHTNSLSFKAIKNDKA